MAGQFTRVFVNDDFTDFSVSTTTPSATAPWRYFEAGPFVSNDATVANAPGFLELNPSPQPFVLTAAQSGFGGLDHVKWLAYRKETFAAPDDNAELVYECRLAGAQNFNVTGALPAEVPVALQASVTDARKDIRLCSAAMTALDDQTWCVCDTFFSDKTIYAFIERLPFGKPGWPVVPTAASGDYHAYSCCVPIHNRATAAGSSTASEPLDEFVTVQMRYNRAQNYMRWLVDGVEKYRYSGFGIPLEPEHRILDHGGPAVRATPASWKFGLGLFTLLDMHNPVAAASSDKGLVAIASPVGAYPNTLTVHPRKMSNYQGTTYAVDSYDDGLSLLANRLFDQGAQLRANYVKIFVTTDFE